MFNTESAFTVSDNTGDHTGQAELPAGKPPVQHARFQYMVFANQDRDVLMAIRMKPFESEALRAQGIPAAGTSLLSGAVRFGCSGHIQPLTCVASEGGKVGAVLLAVGCKGAVREPGVAKPKEMPGGTEGTW